MAIVAPRPIPANQLPSLLDTRSAATDAHATLQTSTSAASSPNRTLDNSQQPQITSPKAAKASTPAKSRATSRPASTSRPSSQPISRPPSRSIRKFTCTHPGCTKAYFKPSRLQEHELTHTGDRPHICTECGQSYLRATHLAAHARTHKSEDDKPFGCPRDGCDKRFWTATHMQRHERTHDSAEIHACTECSDTFPKTHLLREHFAATHMPAGSKPWACTHDGCGKTFAMKQHLRTHEKTHDPTRYTCSHPDHGLDMPTFPVWSALQAHMKADHQPTCPHPDCGGRKFKNAQRLKDHLRVHAERDEDLAAKEAADDVEEDLPPVLSEAFKPRRKRTRVSFVEHDLSPETKTARLCLGSGVSDDDYTPTTAGASAASSPRKLPRISGGEAGKEWACGAPGCGKRFKTRFARDEHAQATHAVAGKHKCDACGRTYRRPASLRRHQESGYCGVDGEEAERNEEEAERNEEEDTEDAGGLLTGMATLPGGSRYRRWACPFDAEEDGCEERFHRVYDVRRHLAASHALAVGELAVREMLLASGQTGADDE